MGSGKSKFEHGTIVLQTTKPYYAPGEIATGNVYISLAQPFPGTQLVLEISGKENVKWTVQKNKGENSYSETVKDKANIFEYTYPIYNVLGPVFPVGQYTFPFNIHLPPGIPSSCNYANSTSARAKAKVTYKIKAMLQPRDRDSMKEMSFKQNLIIRQVPDPIPKASRDQFIDEVNTCCC